MVSKKVTAKTVAGKRVVAMTSTQLLLLKLRGQKKLACKHNFGEIGEKDKPVKPYNVCDSLY